MKALASIVLTAAAVLGSTDGPAAQPATRSVRPAPAVKAPLRLPAMPLHDPWIVADRASGTYHLFTRNERRMTGDARLGIMAYTSRDLKHWSRPHMVFALPPGGWANDGAWAPEVHRWQGRWYLFATFYNDAMPLPVAGARKPVRRSTILAVADRPGGPFALVRNGEPIVNRSIMTLDGTLFVDAKGKPWLVYAHEWVQVGDGTIEAMPLKDDLSAAGPPRLLFRASDAPWAKGDKQPDGTSNYVTDGPELFRTRTGTLLMLWSSYDQNGYVQSLARSKSGGIEGPWEQLPPLVRADSGHGMLFRRFDGTLMMVLHRPFNNARGKLYEMRDTGDSIEVVREATELDGERTTVR
ncbi:glycoside hydrolase family 43 protein [Sphingomonas sp. Leaf343]|uniref:glycoside hydrolase family 43 protein n=1 Tax=Sphingomonas sp. Leaf343 TaxID=1736345 RepID=UPI000A5690E3|nr:glycoside hydrolase family 43 protein [Sphingomonas sp. Leaf343]